MIDALRLLAAALLPWLLGAGLLRVLHRRAREPGDGAWIIGAGWFVGIFVTTLVLRAQSAVGIRFGMESSALAVALLAALVLGIAWRAERPAFVGVGRALLGLDLVGWQRYAWWALLAWLSMRFGLLLAEVIWRPMYPWDAWAQWATKARAWFGQGALAPFVTEPEWLQAPTANVYYDHAPHYPATAPLMQTWTAILLGRWDDALVNLPWWLCAVAFGVATYGFLRGQGLEAISALVGAWLALSLPILDTHVALAGYADLPMATFFSLGALAALRAVRTRERTDLVVAAVLLAACFSIKLPGRAWVLTLVPALTAALLPQHTRRIAAVTFGGALIGMLVLARLEPVIMNYRLQLNFTLPWAALADAYFFYGNWHLMWYAVIGAAVLGGKTLLERELAPLTIAAGAGMLFLLLGFALTSAGTWVEDQSTVNRATLHVAPLLLVWTVLVFHEWSKRWHARNAARAAQQTAASPPAALDERASTIPTSGRLHAPTPAASAKEAAPPERSIEAAPILASTIPAVGRNEPCPCGSGRKYKQCHGAIAAAAAEAAGDDDAGSRADREVEVAMAAHQRGDLEAAERGYRKALALAAAHPTATHYLGVIAYQRGQLADALRLMNEAVAAVPDEPEFHNNLGLALAASDRPLEAAASHRAAIERQPDHAGAWNNLGLVLQQLNRVAEAQSAYRRALELAPAFEQARWNLALALLLDGAYEEGWQHYEARLALPELGQRMARPATPQWDGRPMPDGTVLLICEQGLGDAVQFVRTAGVVAATGMRVLVHAAPALATLLATAPGVHAVTTTGQPFPPHDAHLPLLSVPHALRLRGPELFGRVPYLTAAAEKRGSVQRTLAAVPGLRIGICWAGATRARSVELSELRGLFDIADVSWISLQREAVDPALGVPLHEPPERLTLDGVAALAAELDLVISVDTSIAHIAGALARPTWLLLPFAADWRWGLDRERTDWYPSARLFRQTASGEWADVVSRVRDAIALAREHRHSTIASG